MIKQIDSYETLQIRVHRLLNVFFQEPLKSLSESVFSLFNAVSLNQKYCSNADCLVNVLRAKST
jgi:hypothetical protein